MSETPELSAATSPHENKKDIQSEINSSYYFKSIDKEKTNRPKQKFKCFEDRILSKMSMEKGIKAKDLALLLHKSRLIINRYLYGSLSDKVWQDKDFKWYLKKTDQD